MPNHGTADLFASIAPRYDLLNHVLSLNIDRGWRRELVRRAQVKPGARVLDLCTGTADVAIQFARDTRASEIVGLDVSPEMLAIGRDKIRRDGLRPTVRLVDADALALPFGDSSFDVVTVAFGLRNLADRELGIREMLRVLRDGGRLLILEFAPPPGGVFGGLYSLYLRKLLPLIGGVVSGSRGAYRYLASSVTSFLSPEELPVLLVSQGAARVTCHQLTGGIACLYLAARPAQTHL